MVEESVYLIDFALLVWDSCLLRMPPNVFVNFLGTRRFSSKHQLCKICKLCRNCEFRRQLSGSTLNSTDYCVDLVRRCDYENFVCTLLLPENIRTAAFALRAFNVEVAQVQDMVSNHMIGRMRMQFWRETIDKVFAKAPPHHPVALELTRVLRAKNLSKLWFTRLIESREGRLSGQPFVDVVELENYSEMSVTPVYYLLLEYFGIKNVNVDHLASHVGKATGTSNLLRGVIHNLRSGKIHLPLDTLLKHSVSQEEILRGQNREMLRNVVYDLACISKQHVKLAWSLKNEVPKEARTLFLPLMAVNSYLDRLEKVDFDVSHSSLGTRSALLLPKIWWSAKRKTF